ncbi:hypothetical protein RUM44_005304 [Polyplax serrata]|uniref:Sodium/potassium-transporting ATPase subunit beta-1-interacting protein n=1 Tax=Polyplax serrata TaxID=468196 RepID=A0ABR1AD63_POLSC
MDVCSHQVGCPIVVVECQVFDFMGFMYGPILANFFHIIFIIHGFFGALQYSTKYILSYTLWNVFWVGWTIFVICFYLDIGILDKNSDILNLGTGSRSWWEIHGYGCVADFTSVINGSSLEQDPDPSRPPKPTKVEGCLIEYQYIEIIQAAMQCLLSVLAVIGGMCMSKLYIEEDDSCQTKDTQATTLAQPYYSCQTSRGHLEQYQQQVRANGYGPRPISPRPMTPRRVKRRSVLARDTMNRSSLNHRRQGSSRSKSSQRRGRTHQNPVTKLLEQQNRFLDSSLISTSFNDSHPMSSTVQSSEYSPNGYEATNRFKSGLSNPIFQQSSNSSINQSGADEIYRPNSARSSYSNYHASRPLNYMQNNDYFSNQAVAQVPISTNRNKGFVRGSEGQNNLQSSKNGTTMKSFSQKNFNFLGLNIKNSSSGSTNNNNISTSNVSTLTGRHEGNTRNSKRFSQRVDLTRNTEGIANSFFSQGPPAYREGGLDSETVI